MSSLYPSLFSGPVVLPEPDFSRPGDRRRPALVRRPLASAGSTRS